jgi:hypothetical protein
MWPVSESVHKGPCLQATSSFPFGFGVGMGSTLTVEGRLSVSHASCPSVSHANRERRYQHRVICPTLGRAIDRGVALPRVTTELALMFAPRSGVRLTEEWLSRE